MARVRTDNVFGTITNNPLAIGGTTLNSAGLANLAAVAAAEAIIVLDPNRLTGAPEIVVVTAHTGSATSATILRGQFGTVARQHALGTEWVHGPIASNATTYVTAADDQGDYVPTNAWEAWTPTLTNLTLGNGTLVAKFQRVGTTINWRFKFTLGSTSAVGTLPRFTLPVATHTDYNAADSLLGTAMLVDAGVSGYGGLVVGTGTANQGWFLRTGGSGAANVAVTATAPHTWGTGDVLYASGSYEAAS